MKSESRYLIIFILWGFICGGCSKKDLNLPQSSPMPTRGTPETTISSLCSIHFSKSMSFAKVAIAAHEMRQLCGYSKQEVKSLAQTVFVN